LLNDIIFQKSNFIVDVFEFEFDAVTPGEVVTDVCILVFIDKANMRIINTTIIIFARVEFIIYI
jgi:hypothetical protein